VRLIVPTLGGAGTADTLARILTQELDKRLPQRVVVENRAGANGMSARRWPRAARRTATPSCGAGRHAGDQPALYRETGFDPCATSTRWCWWQRAEHPGGEPRDGAAHAGGVHRLCAANPGGSISVRPATGRRCTWRGIVPQMTQTEMQHVPYSGPAPA